MQIGRLESRDSCILPVGVCQNSRENVGDIEKRSCEKHFLNALILPFDHDQPHNYTADGNGDEAREMKELQTGSNPDKFGNDVAEIRDQDADHHQEGNAKSE